MMRQITISPDNWQATYTSETGEVVTKPIAVFAMCVDDDGLDYIVGVVPDGNSLIPLPNTGVLYEHRNG